MILGRQLFDSAALNQVVEQSEGARIFVLHQKMVWRSTFDYRLAECKVLTDDFLPF